MRVVLDKKEETQIKRIPLARRTLMLRSFLGESEYPADYACYGAIHFALNGASNLESRETYIVITTSFSSIRLQSRSVRAANPVWTPTEIFSFPITTENMIRQYIKITLFNKHTFHKDEYIGYLNISLSEIIRQKQRSGTYELDYERKKKRQI